MSKSIFEFCDDCPPIGYPTDKTRCLECPRRTPPELDTGGQGARLSPKAQKRSHEVTKARSWPPRPVLPSEEAIAKTFYLGMYEREGANWNANESQNVWLSGARAVLALLGKTGGEK